MDCRFKAIGATGADGGCKLGATWCSQDGKHWSAPRCFSTASWTPAYAWDTHNNVFVRVASFSVCCVFLSDAAHCHQSPSNNGAPWVLMGRHKDSTYGRQAARATSPDFLHFGNMSLTIRGTLEEQIYATVGFTASSASGRPSPARQEDELFLGLSMVIHANNTGNYYTNRSLPGNPSELGDEVDVELVMSTDTVSWERVFPGQPFIPRGTQPEDPDRRLIYASKQPFAVNGSVLLYYAGNRNYHDATEECRGCKGALHPGGSLDLARLRLGGSAICTGWCSRC